MLRVPLGFVALLLLTGCQTVSGSSVSTYTGERELRPPRSGIEVGSLYFVREKPTADLSRPATLERLCSVDLAKYGIVAKGQQRVADIDLLSKLDGDGSLDAVKTELATAGLSNSLNDYFEYKLTNVVHTDISFEEAEKIFNQAAFRQSCANWRGNIAGNNWGIYQVSGINEGDISFSLKSGWNADANVSAKLKVIEPKLKAAIKRANQVGYSGQGLVATFAPIARNVSAN